MDAAQARSGPTGQGHDDVRMKHLFDPDDGWPIVTRRQFAGELLTAILIVAVLWAMTLFAYGVAPQP